MNPYGYPGVTGTTLPDTGTVNKAMIAGKPYLCVSYEVEQRTVQPIRLAAGLGAAPVIFYAGHVLRKDAQHRALGYATQAAGVAVAAWSLWIWCKAAWAMRTPPTPPDAA
ncbi:MAG: hypothetical protein EBZ50_11665 [Alphaproteobacteria bacterium]|nr:hypothetical protein [Alphaproteobacteria bacterium]